MGCGSDDSSVDSTTARASNELVALDSALENFDKAMNTSMIAFRDLITSLDNLSHIYSNLSSVSSEAVKDRMRIFSEETRGIQEKGLYSAFNTDVHSGSINVMAPAKKEVKDARKSMEELLKSHGEYESRRKRIESKEADYAKKGKQVSNNPEYQTQLRERDVKKQIYESGKTKFDAQMARVRTNMSHAVTQSSTNLCNCVVSYFTYFRKVVETFGNGTASPKMSSMISSYKPPTLPAIPSENTASKRAPAQTTPANEAKAETHK